MKLKQRKIHIDRDMTNTKNHTNNKNTHEEEPEESEIILIKYEK